MSGYEISLRYHLSFWMTIIDGLSDRYVNKTLNYCFVLLPISSLLLSFWKVKIVLDSVNWIWQLESFHLAQDLCSFTRNCNAFHTICQTSFEISHYMWNYNAFHTIYQIDISYWAWKCNAFRISYQIQFRIFHSIWNCNACQTLNQTWFEISDYTWD